MFSEDQTTLGPLEPIHIAWLDNISNSNFAGMDIGSEPLDRNKLLLSVLCFSQVIKKLSPDKNIGIVLPSSMPTVITMLSAFALGKTIVSINYTASKAAIKSAISQSGIKHIYTSKSFITALEKRGIDLLPLFEGLDVIYLENVKKKVSLTCKAKAAIDVKFSSRAKIKNKYFKKVSINDTAVILFSSGSESAPKGVILTHKNIASNARQCSIALDANSLDIVMSTLPPFHAFGLLATTLMPISEGIPIICHPDPTDVAVIADAIQKNKATIMVATPTFLSFYTKSKAVKPSSLSSIRMVISGAEKLNPTVASSFTTKFSKKIYQGYGATECSPAVSFNSPDENEVLNNKPLTVGRPLIDTEIMIVDPKSHRELPIGADGMVMVSGPQVMKGYLSNDVETTNSLLTINGSVWYKTGDKGSFDDMGFLTIIDRYSRFAKIGGEMISLAEVETYIDAIIPNYNFEFATVSYVSSKGKEKIGVLITDDITMDELRALLLTVGIPKLLMPSACYFVNTIPKLGSGKLNYSEIKALFNSVHKKSV